MKFIALSSLLLPLMGITINSDAQVSPISGHAHNDYYHKQPLLDALSKGFTSIEVDVFPIEDKLYVAHDYPSKLDEANTFEALYLLPLDNYLKQNDGKLYEPDTVQLQLMVDIKQNGEAAYDILRSLLEKYDNMIWHKTNESQPTGKVRIVLSGDRPFDKVLADSMAYMALDGRPSDLGKGYNTLYMPMISQHIRSVISWKGKGVISKQDQDILKNLAQKAHAEDKTVRLWATPEHEVLWDVLINTGIDWINTDNLTKLRTYFTQDR